MISAALFMTTTLAALAAAWSLSDPSERWPIILAGWFALGLSYAASLTPGGRLLRRSSGSEGRPALFAAQLYRKSVVEGKRVAVRVALCGRRTNKKKKRHPT